MHPLPLHWFWKQLAVLRDRTLLRSECVSADHRHHPDNQEDRVQIFRTEPRSGFSITTTRNHDISIHNGDNLRPIKHIPAKCTWVAYIGFFGKLEWSWFVAWVLNFMDLRRFSVVRNRLNTTLNVKYINTSTSVLDATHWPTKVAAHTGESIK